MACDRTAAFTVVRDENQEHSALTAETSELFCVSGTRGCRQLHFGGCSESTLNSLRAGVLFVNRFGQVSMANRAATTLLGMELKELLVTPIDSFLGPISELVTYLGDDMSRLEFRRMMPDGKEAYFGASISQCDTLRHGDEKWHLTVLFQDITRWKVLREERDRLLQMSTVSELLPTMLHELKNPLASIAMSVELLIEEASSGVKQDLEAVLSEVHRMELTLQGVGLAGRELRTQRTFVVDHALSQALTILARQGSTRNISVHNEMGSLPPLPLDSSVLRAVLFNLMTNAIQACRALDSITFRAGVSANQDSFWMEVEDTGVGMSDDTLAQCQELFFTTKPRGSGIGLALCHKVSHEAGGMLSIDSSLGRGTLVRFSVPLSSH